MGRDNEPFERLRTSLQIYARMLWGDKPDVCELRAGTEPSQAHLDGLAWHFPSLPEHMLAESRTIYLAMTAHAAAHCRHGGEVFERGALKPIQRVLVGLLEDSRVEWLAMQEHPGLRSLWGSFHRIEASSTPTLENLLLRLSRALLDPEYRDSHPWVDKGRREFLGSMGNRDRCSPLQGHALRALASRLGNDVGQMRLSFNARLFCLGPVYRDDNAHIWAAACEERTDLALHIPVQAMSSAPGAGEESMPWQDSGRASRDSEPDDGPWDTADVEAQLHGKDERASDARRAACLREWDYVARRYRNNWCGIWVREMEVSSATGAAAEKTLNASHPHDQMWARQVLARASRRSAAVRVSDGDLFDLDALVDARIDQRRKSTIDPDVYLAPAGQAKPGAVVVLLDISASTRKPLGGVHSTSITTSQEITVFERTSALGAALAAVAHSSGHRWELYAFASNTRERIQLWCVTDAARQVRRKDLEMRLRGLTPQWSTRLGAAVRYGAHRLVRSRGQGYRHLVVITDGEPHDVDAPDPRYLQEDLEVAIREATAANISVTITAPTAI